MASATVSSASNDHSLNEHTTQLLEQCEKIRELRIATLGNVDAGKSTLISVLVHGLPDNGRGGARLRIMKNKHERDSGRTSTISNHFIRGPDPLMDGQDVVIDFRDLAGHGKYLKTTVRGMCRPLDYALLVIAANDGILPMTEEHFRLSLNLRVPLFIVITKIDMAQSGSVEAVRKNITKILTPPSKGKKRFTAKKPLQTRQAVFLCESMDDYDHKLDMVMDAYKQGDYHQYIPVFEVSSTPNIPHPDDGYDTVDASKHVSRLTKEHARTINSHTGDISRCQGIPQLLDYIMRLPVYQNYTYLVDKPAAYFVENEFMVKGVGLVLSGIVTGGIIRKGDVLNLGPFYDKFHKITIRSIHNNFREEVPAICAGCSGCIAIRMENSANVTRKMIKGGMRAVAIGAEDNLYWRFRAKVLVQQHPTSIMEGYKTVVHCGAVNQSAKIEKIITTKESKMLRLGDRAEVIFKLEMRPEYIQPGMRMVFREGQTRGVGEVIGMISNSGDVDEVSLALEEASIATDSSS